MGDILYKMDGEIADIVIEDASSLNAITLSMWIKLGEILDSIVRDGSARVICLSGAGDKAFSAGANLKETQAIRESKEDLQLYAMKMRKALKALKLCPIPTIAFINGFCIGGGLALAVACDLAYCTKKSTFMMPAARLDIAYDYSGILQFIHKLGPTACMDLFFTGRTICSEEAREIGLVNKVIEDAEIEAFRAAHSLHVSKMSKKTIDVVKQAVIDQYVMGFDALKDRQ